MPSVIVNVNHRNYTVVCGEGQEGRIQDLADYFAKRFAEIQEAGGHASEIQHMLIAGLTIADEMIALRDAHDELKEEVEREREKAEVERQEAEKRQTVLTEAIQNAGRRVERILHRLTRKEQEIEF